MARVKDLFDPGAPADVAPRNQYAPITDEAWLVECVRMLVTPKPLLFTCVCHRLLAFQTDRGHKVAKGNIAAIRAASIIADKYSTTLARWTFTIFGII
jgi:hypothetical protein